MKTFELRQTGNRSGDMKLVRETSHEYPVVSSDPTRQQFYIELREKGIEHRGAEMLALQQAPAAKNEHFTSQLTLEQQLGDRTEAYVKAARKRGYNPSFRDLYVDAAAAEPGDPAAFAKSAADVRRAFAAREARYQKDKKKPKPVSSLVMETVKQIAAKEPAFAKASKREQIAEAKRRHFTMNRGNINALSTLSK